MAIGKSGRTRVEDPLGGGEIREPKANSFRRITMVTEGTKNESKPQHWRHWH